MSKTNPTNPEIADLLTHIADLLEQQEANPFRIQAYRKASQSVRHAEASVSRLLEQGGTSKLQAELSGVGKSLARVIKEFVTTGHSSPLQRLQGETSPETLFQKVPGIGEEMAHRIVSELDIESLEELELAAHDGRLETLEGMGDKRLQGIRDSLAGMLSRSAQRRAKQRASQSDEQEASIDVLLKVEAEYRRKANAEELQTIAPKRFNPQGKAWLPILHTERNGWSFTALFSNTAKAHILGKTHDWVVIYYERDSEEDQCTVVTQQGGPLDGKRVIRGREQECREYYNI